LNSPGFLGGSGLEFLIAFVAVGGVLAAILYPVFLAAKPVAKQAQQLSLAKQVAVALEIYLADSDVLFPPYKSANEVAMKLDKYLPSDDLKRAARSYTWNLSLSGVPNPAIENIESTWMFFSSELEERKHIVGFVDDHCKVLTEEQFTDALKVKPKITKHK
jgi:hypothetical protein